MIVRTGKTDIDLSFPFIAMLMFMILYKDEKIVIMSLVSSLVHESGHLFFMKIFKANIREVKLGIFGMRIERLSEDNTSYFKEIFISAGGIIFNLIFSLICYIIFLLSSDKGYFMITVINLFVAGVNSLPVEFLDCGRVLYNIFMIYADSVRAETILRCISYICILTFTVITLFICFICSLNISLVVITLYLYTGTLIKKRS